MEQLYVGITNTKWLDFIRKSHDKNILKKHINFWTPGQKQFKALNQGDLFLFKLHNNKQKDEHGEIVGGAYFHSYEKMDIEQAWEQFEYGNGTSSLKELKDSINKLRKKNNVETKNNEIGCIVLYNLFFFEDWLDSPTDWNNNIVSGKVYKLSTDIGKNLYMSVKESINDETFNIDTINEIESSATNLQLSGKEREAYIKIRVNQSIFRKKLLRSYHCCCLCQMENTELLRASHIKPWSKSEAEEKIDVDNGLLLCPNHDAVFDAGLISFSDNGEILISKKLSQEDCQLLNINSKMKIKLTEKSRNYLAYHRKNIFERHGSEKNI